MNKERGEREGKRTRKVDARAKELDHLKKQTREDVSKIRPILEKDRDWPLVSGQREPETKEERGRKRRSLTRLTKKTINLLYPNYKASARYDRGTAYNWVRVNINTLEKTDWPKSLEIMDRTRATLESVGLQYAGYFSDSLPGKDGWASCLLIEVNNPSWIH